jgi:SAM-dependent methyltransferase
MGQYDEYLERTNWKYSAGLLTWVHQRILKVFIRVAQLNPSEVKLLEIGSGRGTGGQIANQMGFAKYVGVEPTQALAAFSRESYGHEVVEDFLPELVSIKTASMDAIFSIHVLEHASSHLDAWAWVKEMKRVVRPGGHILICTPDAQDYGTYFWDSDWSHGYPTTPRRLSQILQDHGLELVFVGKMHFGSLSPLVAAFSHFFALLLPTRLGDRITQKLFGRPLVSGLKIAVLWGLTYVIAKKL